MLTVDALAPYEHETATEAGWRAIAGLVRTITGLARGDVPFSELRPGDAIRLAGENVWIVSVHTAPTHDADQLRVENADGARSWYPVSHGETFDRVGF